MNLTQQVWYENYVHFVELKGLQPRSVKSYLGWVKQLHDHFNVPDLRTLSSAQVLAFLNHLLKDRKLAGSTLNQAVCGLRTFYRDYLKKRWKIWGSIKIKREEVPPTVLTRAEVELMLKVFRQGRYRAFFTTMYQCGLRLSECCQIRPKDIDRERLLIRIKGKGAKWRNVPISAELYQRLRVFWSKHRNPNWLFPGTGRGWKSSGISLCDALYRCDHCITKASVWSAIRVASAEAGLLKKHDTVTCHTLRHSYATHMLEAGAHVRQVSAYLGHTTLKPTLVYLHLTEFSEQQARQALNSLAGG